MTALDDVLPIDERLHAQVENPTDASGASMWLERTAPAVGIMLHYDGSAGADKWAIGWFLDKRCEVGYDVLVTDDARVILIHDGIERYSSRHGGPGLPEQHIPVGTMRMPNGTLLKYGRINGAYYGVSVTTGPGHPVTPAQAAKVAVICAAIITYHRDRWVPIGTAPDLSRLIVSHASRAIYTHKYTKDITKWGKIGRKDDPEGPDPVRPVMSTEAIRIATAMLLTPAPAPVMFPAMGAPAGAPPDDPWGLFSPGGFLFGARRRRGK